MPDIREVLAGIAARLGGAPDRAAALIKERAGASDRLHRALGAMEEFEAKIAGEVAAEKDGNGRPAFPNGAARKAGVLRRLAADPEYRALKEEADAARMRLRELDAGIERASLRHKSDVVITHLAAALIGAGKAETAEAVLAAYHSAGADAGGSANANGTDAGDTNARDQASQDRGQGSQAVAAQAQVQPQVREQGQNNGLGAAVFTVLEARPGGSPGTVRAWCEGQDGRRVAVYGKNGAGEALAGAVGRRVEIRYRKGDRGLIALSVRLAG